MANPYATVDEFKEFLFASGLTIKGSPEAYEDFFDFQNVLDSAASLFENATGCVFVATPKVRTYDWPTNLVVNFRDQLLDYTKIALVGNTLVENKDFYLRPTDAPLDGDPYSHLILADVYRQLYTGVGYSSRRALVITGSWGRLAVPSALVKSGVLAKAATLAAPRLSTAITKGLMSWSAVDGRRQEYAHYADQVPLAAERRMWLADASEAESYYTKVQVM